MPYVRGVRQYKYYNDEDLDVQSSVEELQNYRLSQVPVFNPAVTIAAVEEALRRLPAGSAVTDDTAASDASPGGDVDKEPFQFFAEGDLPLSDISVTLEGVGEIGLPLEEEIVQKIIDLSSKVKSNESSVEIVEDKVENDLLIPANELKVDVKEDALNLMLKKISCCLNIDSMCVVKPEVRGLSVCGPGRLSGFQKSVDEDADKLVRLELVLPSRDEGELLIKHGGRTHKSRARASDSAPWVAYHADCARREVGHRVVLRYDLELQYPETLEQWGEAGEEAEAEESLDHAVAEHLSQQGRLVVLLQHRYAEDTLAWRRTRGRDRTYARALVAVARRQGLRASLALGTCLESWESSGYHGPVRNGGRLELTLWVDEDGLRTARGLVLDYDTLAREACWLGGPLWSQGEPDRETRLGWYGEGPAIREQWYHKTCVVITNQHMT